MKHLLTALFIATSFFSLAQSSEQEDKKEIENVLKAQQTAWSNYNLEDYMQGYWKNDSLKFYGSNGLTYGWKNTLEGYKKRYPSPEHTGELNFKINDISKITEDAYFVLGEYHLKRSVGHASGFFMLVFKKIKGEWKIIADTTC